MNMCVYVCFDNFPIFLESLILVLGEAAPRYVFFVGVPRLGVLRVGNGFFFYGMICVASPISFTRRRRPNRFP